MSYRDKVPSKKMKIKSNQFTNAIAPNENSTQGFHSYKCKQASKKDFLIPSGSLELSDIGPFQPVEGVFEISQSTSTLIDVSTNEALVIDSDEQPLLTCMLGRTSQTPLTKGIYHMMENPFDA